MGDLCIVKDGRSPYHIVGSYFADECERYAAAELQKYLYRATGTFVPYFSDICGKRTLEILVGKNARNAGVIKMLLLVQKDLVKEGEERKQ